MERTVGPRDHIVPYGVLKAEGLAEGLAESIEDVTLPDQVTKSDAMRELNAQNRERRMQAQIAELRETNARLGKLIDVMVDENDALYLEVRTLRGQTAKAVGQVKAINRLLA